MSAGARLTVMRLAGSARPEAMRAERTRSRDSATALSPRPTIMKTTVPEAICTCTSTGLASTPSKATVDTRDTISPPSGYVVPVGTFAEQGAECKGKFTRALRSGRSLAVICVRRSPLDTLHPPIGVGGQSALGLIQHDQFVAKGITNARATADCNIE